MTFPLSRLQQQCTCTWCQPTSSQDFLTHFLQTLQGRKVAQDWKVISCGLTTSLPEKLHPGRRRSWWPTLESLLGELLSMEWHRKYPSKPLHHISSIVNVYLTMVFAGHLWVSWPQASWTCSTARAVPPEMKIQKCQNTFFLTISKI